MKKWPEKGFVKYNDLIDPVKELLVKATELGDDVYNQGLEYTGYEIDDVSTNATCASPEESLTKKHLIYNRDEQGLDVFDTILQIAFQLGYVQGKRSVQEKIDAIQAVMNGINQLSERADDMLKLLLK